MNKEQRSASAQKKNLLPQIATTLSYVRNINQGED
jgi:hypothetical protein